MRKKERTFIKQSTSYERGWRIFSLFFIFLGLLLFYLETEIFFSEVLLFPGLGWFILNECFNRGIIEPNGAKGIRVYITEALNLIEVKPFNLKKVQGLLDHIEILEYSYDLDLPKDLKNKVSQISEYTEWPL